MGQSQSTPGQLFGILSDTPKTNHSQRKSVAWRGYKRHLDLVGRQIPATAVLALSPQLSYEPVVDPNGLRATLIIAEDQKGFDASVNG